MDSTHDERWGVMHGPHCQVLLTEIEATDDCGTVLISTVRKADDLYETRIFGGPKDNRARKTPDRETAWRNHCEAISGELTRTGTGVNFIA